MTPKSKLIDMYRRTGAAALEVEEFIFTLHEVEEKARQEGYGDGYDDGYDDGYEYAEATSP